MTVLFVRVLSVEPGSLRLELWQYGEIQLARSVKLQMDRVRLNARRIALVAAELTRRLKRRRLLAHAEQERREKEQNRKKELERPLPRLTLRPSLEAALLPGADWVMAGPRLEAGMQLTPSASLHLGGAWLQGSLSETNSQWLEFAIMPQYQWALSRSLDLTMRLEAAAASVHLSDVLGVDQIRDQRDTWSARAALGVFFEPRLSRLIKLSMGPSLGALLRPVPYQDSLQVDRRAGGLWLGLKLGVEVDPS